MVADVAVAVLFLVVSAAGEILSVWWQDARECRKPRCAGLLSVALGALNWLPVMALVATEDWLIIPADLAGNYVGSYLGVRWRRRNSVDRVDAIG
jgi:hypothetical protein